MRRRLGLVLTAFVVATFPCLSADQALANHVHCGDVITQDTTLDSDLIDCPVDGIVVGANDITLDLNGHSVEGSGTSLVGIANGDIYGEPEGHDGVTIRNGSVRDFSVGVGIAEVAGTVVRDLTVSNVVRDRGAGIWALRSPGTRIQDNTIRRVGFGIDLGGSGASLVVGNDVSGSCVGIHLDDAFYNVVRRNDASGNSCVGIVVVDSEANQFVRNTVTATGSEGLPGPGIAVTDAHRNLFERNVLARNDVGIVVSDYSMANRITRNSLSANAVDGVAVIENSSGNVLTGNVATDNGDDGLDIDASENIVMRNLANANGDLGIDAVPGVVDGGHNRAFGNGNPLQCVNVVCKTKPAK
jgi:parallel beta-helix repeat protein